MEKKSIKTSSDIIWNYASVGITAICGAAFSIIISIFYPEDVLGRFNTVYSFYIVMSQFCVFGIHMAVVKFVAERRDEALGILTKSIMVTTVISCAMSGTFYCIINFVLASFIGESMVISFNSIIPALILFSINKVFLGWLNGAMLMKAYAFFQLIRNVVIAFSLLVFSLIGIKGVGLTYCFLISEIVVLLLSASYFLLYRLHHSKEKTSITARELLWFGLRILPSNAVLELNSKIDVICLALVLGDEGKVGIYSFAAMFAEGFYQLVVVLRKIINPSISIEYVKGKLKEYIETAKKRYSKKIYFLFFVAYLLLILAYNVLVWITGNNNYYFGTIVLIIICFCILLTVKPIVFGNILAQTGYPGTESMVNVISALSNGVLNFIFIYFWGMIGAALATGISYFIYSALQYKMFKKKTGIEY